MAENYVVKEPLTDAMIEAGAEVTKKLMDMGIPITAALWLWDPETSDDWRLVFSSPDVDSRGFEVYRQIQQALKELGAKAAAAPFFEITLSSPNSELVRGLKLEFKTTGPDIQRIRLKRGVAHNHYIHDALIYRVA